MCRCDCLFVEALMDGATVDENRQAQRNPQGQTVTVEAQRFASIDQVPQLLCGWSMPKLLHRRRRSQEDRKLIL